MKLLAALIIISTSAFAAETVHQVRFDVLIVRVPEAKAVAILPRLRDPAKAAAAQEELVSMLGKGAELVDWPTLTTGFGRQATVENINEYRYPTEFEAPSVVLDASDYGSTPVPAPLAPDPAPKQPDTDKKKHIKLDGELKLTGGTPTTFEVKNLGVVFQVEPSIAPGLKHLEFTYSLQHQRLIGSRKNTIEVSPTYKVSVEQPDFMVLKTSSFHTVASGQPTLLSFHKLREPINTVELAICTATILDTGIPAERLDEPNAEPPTSK